MTTRLGSKFVSLVLVAPFVALAACAPAPAPLLSPVDERALNIMVAPPIPCSDLKIDLVNTYAGCENYGGMLDGEKFTKYSRPSMDAAMMTAVNVRCYDLRPERIIFYKVCRPTIALIERIGDDSPGGPARPVVVLAHAENTSGTPPNEAFTSVTRYSDGGRYAEARAGSTSSEAWSQPNPDGTWSVSAGNMRATRHRDGSFTDISFDN